MLILLKLEPTTIFFFFFNDTATTEIYTLSLHDALPISSARAGSSPGSPPPGCPSASSRSEEHTSELQSRSDLVCRLLLEKKKQKQYSITSPNKKKELNEHKSTITNH